MIGVVLTCVAVQHWEVEPQLQDMFIVVDIRDPEVAWQFIAMAVSSAQPSQEG